MDVIQMISKGNMKGFDANSTSSVAKCSAFVDAKQDRAAAHGSLAARVGEHVVHLDIIGPIEVPS